MTTTSPILVARYISKTEQKKEKVGIVDLDKQTIRDITGLMAGKQTIQTLSDIFELTDRVAKLEQVKTEAERDRSEENLNTITLKAPIPDAMPVWAAGVTYDRSRQERNSEQKGFVRRMAEGVFFTVYDWVYQKKNRPELFLKAMGEDVVANKGIVGFRKDFSPEHGKQWSVPEPELTLVFNSKGERVGYTMGNDMSSRDIEGENPIYLPQAKVYYRSASVGPFVAITDGKDDDTVRTWDVQLDIERGGQAIEFKNKTNIGQITRKFDELRNFLFRCQRFKHGAALLTGTGIVPPQDFTLQNDDIIKIKIGPLGTLENKAKEIPYKIGKDGEKAFAKAEAEYRAAV